tara:strand:- start:1165 stop:1509 length:345 start_codon:yes stop_codon:yes gene_type:complete
METKMQRFADHISAAVNQYELAKRKVEEAANAIHPDVLGRAPTKSEINDFHHKNNVRRGAVSRICKWPVADFAGLRAKAKALYQVMRSEDSLPRKDVDALLQSILQMNKKTEAD